MDGVQYDAKILAATMLLRGVPPEAARKITNAAATLARKQQKLKGVHGPKTSTPPLGARAWYEVQKRIDDAKKVISDALDAWKTAATDAAKKVVRDAVTKAGEAIEGAKEAAEAAKSSAAKTWADLKAAADDAARQVGAELAGVAGIGVGLLVLAAVLLFSSVGSSANRERGRRFLASR